MLLLIQHLPLVIRCQVDSRIQIRDFLLVALVVIVQIKTCHQLRSRSVN